MPNVEVEKRKFDNLSIPSSTNHIMGKLRMEILSRPWARASRIMGGDGRGLFETEPVDTRTFFREYYREVCFPRQQMLIDAIFGKDPYKWCMNYKDFVVLWGMGSLHFNTLIEHKGGIHKIGDLAKDGPEYLECVRMLDKDGNETIGVLRRPYIEGYGMLYRVELEDGKTVDVTADHRFFTKSGWKKIADIQEGEEVAVGD